MTVIRNTGPKKTKYNNILLYLLKRID